MAKRKKAQLKKQPEPVVDPESNEDAFLSLCLQQIKEQESQGIRLVLKSDKETGKDKETQPKTEDQNTRSDPINTRSESNNTRSDPNNTRSEPEHLGSADQSTEVAPEDNEKLLEDLGKLCSAEDMQILRESGAFGEVELKVSDEDMDRIRNLDPNFAQPYRAPPPPVPIYGDKPSTTSSEALGQELRYLATVMQPAEMRWLVSELAGDMLEKSPVTHTDISDAVIASIAPSTAQKVAFMADAQYKYTTAQFLQVYLKMRHVVLEHKIMLGSARADAMLLASSDLEIPDLLPGDMDVPVSAVNALRDLIDKDK